MSIPHPNLNPTIPGNQNLLNFSTGFFIGSAYLILNQLKQLIFLQYDISIQYYKEDPEGVGKMCEAMDRIAEKRAVEARIENALKMLADGQLSLEKIAQYSGLPLEKVKELADKRTA